MNNCAFDGLTARLVSLSVCLAFALVIGIVPAHAQAGALDLSFNSTGFALTPVGSSDSQSNAVAVQADGKTVVAGWARGSTTGQDFAVVRYNADGSLDTSFDGDGKVTTSFGGSFVPETANAVAVQPDGKIIAAGFTGAFGPPEFALVRYNADGSLDATFDGDGKLITDAGGASGNDTAYAIALQADGKIVVAGYASTPASGSLWDMAVVRYNADGSLDTTFDGDGKAWINISSATNDIAYSVAVQADGKIVAAGISGSATTGADFAAVRLNANGTLDTGFDTDGKVTTAVGPTSNFDQAWSIAIQADGRLVAAGYADMSATSDDFALVRYNADGSLDTTFDLDGIVTTPVGSGTIRDRAYAVALQTDGKIVAGGYRQGGTTDDLALIRYNGDGSLDTSFSGDGITTIDIGGFAYVFAMAPYSSNRVVAAAQGANNFLAARIWLEAVPTAAPVSVSGRVTDVYGRGIRGARLTLADAQGVNRYATTNSFGYYTFVGVQAGEGYILSASAKGHTFADPVRYLEVNDQLAGVDFTVRAGKTGIVSTQQASTPTPLKKPAPAPLRITKGKRVQPH